MVPADECLHTGHFARLAIYFWLAPQRQFVSLEAARQVGNEREALLGPVIQFWCEHHCLTSDLSGGVQRNFGTTQQFLAFPVVGIQGYADSGPRRHVSALD